MCFTSYKLLSALQPKFIQNDYNIQAEEKKSKISGNQENTEQDLKKENNPNALQRGE